MSFQNFKQRQYEPLESTTKTKIIKYLKALPKCMAIARPQRGYSRKGDPDIYGAIDGWHFELEVKRKNKKCTALQTKRLEQWAACNCIIGRVESVEDVKEVFRIFGVDVYGNNNRKKNVGRSG